MPVKLGPVELRRVKAADAPRPRRTEIGAAGTINQRGWLQGHEYLSELRHPQSIGVFDRMRRSDAAVREALGHIWAPIKNATWEVEPASDDELDLEVAAFIRCAYFDWLSHPFSQYMHQSLLHLVSGFQLFETPLHVVEDEIEIEQPDGGETKTVRKQWVTWRRFAQRLPETIRKWNVEDGELVSVEQWAWKGDTYGQWEIPADLFLLFVNEQEGDDYTGVSLLRSAYKPWFMKELVEKVMGVAAERHGIGINTTYLPDKYAGDEAMVDRVEDMMRDIGSGDRPYAVFPFPKSTAGSGAGGDGGFFEIVTPESTIPDLVAFCEYLRGDIKGNVLARFAELGHGSVGARATGDVQSLVWFAALESVARYISDVNQTAIRRLVDMNYDVTRYPRLCAQDIESRNLEEFANAHAKLTAAGAINTDTTYRAFVRQVLGAPDEDEPEESDMEPLPEDQDGPDKPRPEDQREPEPQRYSHQPEQEERPDRTDEILQILAQVVTREPAAPEVHVSPEINLDLGKVDGLAGAITALADRSIPAPVVNVNLDDLVTVLRDLLEREPTPANVQVTVPEQPAPQITVNVPEQKPPVVNVTPEITVEQPKTPARQVELERDQAGKLKRAVVTDV